MAKSIKLVEEFTKGTPKVKLHIDSEGDVIATLENGKSSSICQFTEEGKIFLYQIDEVFQGVFDCKPNGEIRIC